MLIQLETLYDIGGLNPEICVDICSLCVVDYYTIQFYDIIPAPIARSIRLAVFLWQPAATPFIQTPPLPC